MVGFAGWREAEGQVMLSRAGVLDTYRGKGLYPRMVLRGLKHFKSKGHKSAVTDCTTWNVGSARGLLKAGFKPFWPATPWALPDSIYWWRDL